VIEWAKSLDPILQAFYAGLFTWGITAMGAASVLFSRNVSRRFLDVMLGFAAGVMIAASFFSLIQPAIAMADALAKPAWFVATTGFVAGGVFLGVADRFLPHLHPWLPLSQAEGIHTNWNRTVLLVLAITLHNIPEGLAIGVAFGAIAVGAESGITGGLEGALILSLGIGIQNFPEGIAVALPLRGEGVSRVRALFFGQLSAVVEPVAAVVGVAAVLYLQPLLPYALAFAAGAMIYVVVEELIPESHYHGNPDIATLGALAGFSVMMALDVGLG